MIDRLDSTHIRNREVWSIETEDWGAGAAMIITRVRSGGHVVSACRTTYGRLLGLDAQTRGDRITEQMRQQHLRCVIRLDGGEFDAKLRRSA